MSNRWPLSLTTEYKVTPLQKLQRKHIQCCYYNINQSHAEKKHLGNSFRFKKWCYNCSWSGNRGTIWIMSTLWWWRGEAEPCMRPWTGQHSHAWSACSSSPLSWRASGDPGCCRLSPEGEWPPRRASDPCALSPSDPAEPSSCVSCEGWRRSLRNQPFVFMR